MNKVSLQYQGIVQVSSENSEITIHNEGMQGISELFTRGALGYPTANYRPYYIDIQDSDGKSKIYNKVEIRALSFGEITADEIEKEEDAYLEGWKYPVFDALVLSDNFSIEDIIGTRFLVLYSKNMRPIARVQIEISDHTDGEKFVVVEGNNLLIRWFMYLSNRTEEDNNE